MDRKRQKVLIHTHGIGKFDFSSLSPERLPRVDSAARAAQMRIVPGIFLRHDYLDTFTRVLHRYAAERDRYDQLLGFSVEGPLLGRVGGVPPRRIWSPTADEWERIAELGALGLRYVVSAPDGGDLDTRLEGETTYRDVIDLFYTNGVRIALGHFRHDSPELSAARSAAVIDYIQDRYGPSPDLVLSDRLFNDMPRRFRHIWRTPEERAERDAQLAAFLAHDWDCADLTRLLGVERRWQGPRARPGDSAPAACRPNPDVPRRQPGLAAMAAEALRLLGPATPRDPGFFLLAESAQIDNAGHDADPCGVIGEVGALDEAVRTGLDYAAGRSDTLVIVTADHGHSCQIVPVDVACPGSSAVLRTPEGGTMKVNYSTNLPGEIMVHTGAQVRVAAYGPGARAVAGLMDHTDLFSLIRRALTGGPGGAHPAHAAARRVPL